MIWREQAIQAVFQEVKIHEVMSAVSLTQQSQLSDGAPLPSDNSYSLYKIIYIISELTMHER